ncbi:acyl-CoA carboxylase epsilon subunit [Streptomyces sp. SID3343]|uniref:acyl-CoA carboxylase epsilon subunit n=1 Tax=Streptomyces sp. SID3343 TaxID=2690260 RepID=UPI001371EA98|nr:hypothetical protein [Streptomyces sp. SID3343]
MTAHGKAAGPVARSGTASIPPPAAPDTVTVVRGNPTEEELKALLLGLAAVTAAVAPAQPPRSCAWTRHAREALMRPAQWSGGGWGAGSHPHRG